MNAFLHITGTLAGWKPWCFCHWMLHRAPAVPDTTAHEVPLHLCTVFFVRVLLSRKQSKSYLVGVSV